MWWVVMVCLLGLLARLWLAWQDMATLVGKVVADDFFYYLTIARNLAAGQGPTFDGLTLTNGFHPLYTLALTPLIALAGENRELGVHLALSLVAVMDVLVAALLYTLLARRVSRAAGIVAALSWLANPWAMTTALNGVESAIYLLMVVITLAVYLPKAEQVWNGGAVALLVGVLGGLTVLGRTDGIFLIGAILLDGVWRAGRRRARWSAVVRADVVVGVGFLVTTAPWWLWNLANFGSLMQVSGQALLMQWHGADWLRPGNYVAGTFTALRRYGLRLVVFLVQMWPLLVLAILALVARRAPAPSPRRGGGQGEGRSDAAHSPSPHAGQGTRLVLRWDDLFVPLVYAAGLAVWYVFCFWHMQNWYLMPVLLAGSLVTGYLYPALDGLVRTLRLRSVVLVGAYFVLSFVAIFAAVWLTRGFGYPRQVQGLRIAEWANASTQPAESIGAWNAGVVGYFSRRRVVNLDGVTNNDLYRWVSERHLALTPAAVLPYAAERGITYITDYEDILAPILGTPSGSLLSEAARLPDSHIVIYRVQRR